MQICSRNNTKHDERRNNTNINYMIEMYKGEWNWREFEFYHK